METRPVQVQEHNAAAADDSGDPAPKARQVGTTTWRTSGSRSSRCSRTCAGPSCTCELSPGPKDRRGLDQSEGSRWTAAPENRAD